MKRGYIDFKTNPDTRDLVLSDDGIEFDETGVSSLVGSLFTEKAKGFERVYWNETLASHLWTLKQEQINAETISAIQDVMDDFARDVVRSGLFDDVDVDVDYAGAGVVLDFILTKENSPDINARIFTKHATNFF